MSENIPTLLVPWHEDSRCSRCRQIKVDAVNHTIEHHPEKALKISAARGCPLCQFLYKELCFNSYVGTLNRSERHLRVSCSTGKVQVMDFNNTSHHFEIFSATDATSSKSMYRTIGPHADSELCWKLVRKWISECTTDHVACRQPMPKLPSRVIDVSDTPRLVVREECKPHERYIALSHCWGQGFPMPKTTRSNYSSFVKGVDLSLLPKTFRDAVLVTRKLGITYLWIDALCIIQDDRDDWRNEATNMGNYYRDSFLTLSALSAPDGDIGFLNRRPKISEAVLEHDQFIRPGSLTWREVFQHSPLSQRGWVLQERLLSTRVLHFEENELFWECLSVSAREGSTEEHSLRGQGEEWADMDFKRSLIFAPGPSETADVENIMSKWYRILCQYSALRLTLKSDVYPAIAGIAQRFGEATGFRYMAGLWLEHIHWGLLWHSNAVPGEGFQRAPSWSWASIGGPIKMIFGEGIRLENSRIDLVVADFKVSPDKAPLCFSLLTFAKMHLNAHCFDVWCRRSSKSLPPYNDPFLRLVMDIFDETGILIGTGYLDRPAEQDLLKCTAIVVVQREEPELGSEAVTYFLLAKVTVWPDSTYYQRIGVGQGVDRFHGCVFDGFRFEGHERTTFLFE